MLFDESACNPSHVLGRKLEGCTAGDPGHHLEPAGRGVNVRIPTPSDERVGEEKRRRNVCSVQAVVTEVGGHDADDLIRGVVDGLGGAHHFGVSTEARVPHSVRKDDFPRSAAERGGYGSPHCRLNAKNVEELGLDSKRSDPLRLLGSEAHVGPLCGGQALERALLGGPLQVLTSASRQGTAGYATFTLGSNQPDKAVRIRERSGSQEHLVHDRHDRHGEADSGPKDDHRGQRREGLPHNLPYGSMDIVPPRVPMPPTYLRSFAPTALSLSGSSPPFSIAELTLRLFGSVGFTPSSTEQFSRLLVEVEVELLADRGGGPILSEGVLEEPPKSSVDHGPPSVADTTLSMAAEYRRHVSSSSSSRRPPSSVRW